MGAGPIVAPAERAPAVVTLRPGDVLFAKEPTVVRTVLGSCLSVTMHCARLGAGAICHALFPGGVPAAGGEAFRYVDVAIDGMAAWFDRAGARRGEIAVKLFGGAGTRWSGEGAPASIDVGRSNVESALRTLAGHGLSVAASDVGGTLGRKIYFLSHTGEVYVKRLPAGRGIPDTTPGRRRVPREGP